MFVFPCKSQHVAGCSPTRNDSIIINELGITFEVDSFQNDTLVRRRIFADWGLMSEVNYNPDGTRGEAFHSRNNANKEWVRNLDYNTGHWMEAGWDERGQIKYFQEMATDSFDAKNESYYPNGNLYSKGYCRQTLVKEVKSYTDSTFTLKNVKTYPSWIETQVGLWHYYYGNGVDSAIGNFAYVLYVFETIFPSSPGDLYIAIGTTTFSEVKDGIWNYFSTDGKLIRREEWHEGNLLKREIF